MLPCNRLSFKRLTYQGLSRLFSPLSIQDDIKNISVNEGVFPTTAVNVLTNERTVFDLSLCVGKLIS